MGLSVMLWGAEKLVPAEYWCPLYGTPYQEHKKKTQKFASVEKEKNVSCGVR